jgi:hypothetical protein
MKIKLECPEARYDSEMRIWCRVNGKLCACQRWCLMKGRAVLTDMAPDCLAREHTEQERTDEE